MACRKTTRSTVSQHDRDALRVPLFELGYCLHLLGTTGGNRDMERWGLGPVGLLERMQGAVGLIQEREPYATACVTDRLTRLIEQGIQRLREALPGFLEARDARARGQKPNPRTSPLPAREGRFLDAFVSFESGLVQVLRDGLHAVPEYAYPRIGIACASLERAEITNRSVAQLRTALSALLQQEGFTAEEAGQIMLKACAEVARLTTLIRTKSPYGVLRNALAAEIHNRCSLFWEPDLSNPRVAGIPVTPAEYDVLAAIRRANGQALSSKRLRDLARIIHGPLPMNNPPQSPPHGLPASVFVLRTTPDKPPASPWATISYGASTRQARWTE